MSNKTRLQTNNTNLQVLINKVNALPDAGGPSTCTLTIENQDAAFSLYYTGYSGGSFYSSVQAVPLGTIQLQMLKNSIVYFDTFDWAVIGGDGQRVCIPQCIYIDNNATIYISLGTNPV